MIGLTGKPTGTFRKTYCLQPKQFAMWQTLIAMQAQISARACFSATKVGRHAAVPPFHILLVFRQLHFFFLGWRRRYTIQISPHVVFTITCQALVKPRFRVWMLQYIRETTAVDNMKIEPAMPLMKIPHYQPWRQSRAQSSPAQRWVGRRGDLWGHEKNMIFFYWLSEKQSLGGSRSCRKSSKKDIYFHWLWLISGSQQKGKEEGEMFWRKIWIFFLLHLCHV